jgi:pimeloyl-ACP methyl ester carboxylesterase
MTLNINTTHPTTPTTRPPIILIHGAANSARVWTSWQPLLAERGYASHAIDLRGHGDSPSLDLSATTMQDYADDVASLIGDLPSCVLMGWSMGGLVAMIAAERATNVRACIGLAPSTPAQIRDASIALRTGEFDAGEYGITNTDPDHQSAMPDLDREERVCALSSLSLESRYARDERAAGVVVASLPCPLFIVTGTADAQWPRSRYTGMHLPEDHLSVEGASHWGLVLSRRALATLVPAVTTWLDDRA